MKKYLFSIFLLLEGRDGGSGVSGYKLRRPRYDASNFIRESDYP